MKTALAVILAAVIGFTAAYFYFTGKQEANQRRDLAARQSEWQTEKDALEQALVAARNKPAEIRTVRVPVYRSGGTNKISAQETLDILMTLKPGAGEESRNRIFRQIVHHLQMLVENGPEALPVIQQFLVQNKDVDYANDELNESGERVNRSFASRNPTRTDFLVPPSLRLGLFDVLEQIGGESAERILADMLATTGRGVEVAYLARVLQDLAPNKYRQVALTAAKELLANLPTIDQPTRLDDNARAYLYQVLAMYNDTSFAQNAQAMLLTKDGHIDKQALNYLDTSLKDQAIPSVVAAYKDPRITSQTEKANLLNVVLSYTGRNPQANQVFGELIANEETPTAIRAYTIESLARNYRGEEPNDPQLIKGRMQLLQNLKSTLRDERLLQAIDKTTQNLQALLTAVQAPPKPASEQ